MGKDFAQCPHIVEYSEGSCHYGCFHSANQQIGLECLLSVPGSRCSSVNKPDRSPVLGSSRSSGVIVVPTWGELSALLTTLLPGSHCYQTRCIQVRAPCKSLPGGFFAVSNRAHVSCISADNLLKPFHKNRVAPHLYSLKKVTIFLILFMRAIFIF